MPSASSWVLPGVVVAALVGVGGYSMMHGDCGSCVLSRALHPDTQVVSAQEPAKTGGCCALSADASTTLVADSAPDSCCETTKGAAVLAAGESQAPACCMSEAGEVVLASGEAACSGEAECASQDGATCSKGEACCKAKTAEATDTNEEKADDAG